MRKKHPDHVNLERWLVSYADFITLLFATFVVLYALSQQDISKFKSVAAAIRAAFSAAGPVGMVAFNQNSGGETVNQFDSTTSNYGRAVNLDAGRTNTAADPDPELQNIKDKLEETISLELGMSELADKIQMQFDSRGLIVRLAAKDFFDQGAVVVRTDMQPVMDRIGKIVASTNRLVRVEGHTDPSEARTENYPTDWELSAARAAWVVKYWIKRFDVDPKRFGAAGYSHFRPLSGGKDEWSQAKNRRVEIIILNNRYEGVSPEVSK